jgi:hypothetical protein
MKIVKLISSLESVYVNNFRELERKQSGTLDISMNAAGPAQPMVGQCHMFVGCNQNYALYPNGDTYQQCVARRNASPTPHSWRSPLGCVDIP